MGGESLSPMFGRILRDWSWPYVFQMPTSLEENSVTYYCPILAMTERRYCGKWYWRRVTDTGQVIFNKDSNKALTLGINQLILRGTFQRGLVWSSWQSCRLWGRTWTLQLHGQRSQHNPGHAYSHSCGSQDIYYFCTGLKLLCGSMQLWQAQLSTPALKPGRAQRLVMRQMRALTIMPCSKRCQKLSVFT